MENGNVDNDSEREREKGKSGEKEQNAYGWRVQGRKVDRQRSLE